MAEPVYCNYRLYKTLPKLSGNMKLDLVLGAGQQGNAYVRQAHLRPLTNSPFVPVVDERLMDRPHQNNIKKFYEKTHGTFYNSEPPADLASDWYKVVSEHDKLNLKYLKNWDDTCLAGTSRMSYKLYGTTHECLVPVWLDKCNGIKLILEFLTIGDDGSEHTICFREVNISEEYLYGNIREDGSDTYKPLPFYNVNEKFHNDFVKYMMDYFNYVQIMNGNTSVLNINFKSGISTVSGLKVESGIHTTQQNFNIVRNLMYRERPVLETNSLITNTLQDYKMICSQLINFNLCFDLEEMLTGVVDIVKSGGAIACKVDVLALRPRSDVEEYFVQRKNRTDLREFYRKTELQDKDLEYVWTGPCEVRDFYTNHDYIPRKFINLDYTTGSEIPYYKDDKDYWWNVLNYKKDNHSSEMMHQNKITQGICHWVYARQPDGDLFNVYDGFGAYAKKDDEYIDYGHGNGSNTDTSVDEYDPSADNTIWAGAPRIGDGDDIECTLNAPDAWIENGYFKDTANIVGGFEFNFTPKGEKAPKKLYIGTMTTPWDSTANFRKTAATSYMTSRHFIGILIERLGTDGESDMPKDRQEQSTKFDVFYDWHKHSDIDNRFAVRKIKGTIMQHVYFDTTKIKSDGMQEALKSADHGYEYAIQNHIIRWMTPSEWESSNWDAATYGEKSNWERVGGTGPYNTSMRQHMNSTALYVCMRRMPMPDKQHRDDDALCVILYHPRAKKEEHEENTAQNVLFGDLWPHGLTLGGFMNAIKDYYNKYDPMMDVIDIIGGDPEIGNIDMPDNLPDMDELDNLVQAALSVRPHDVIWFNNSIEPQIDYTLSRNADEIKYYKRQGMNNYVLRYGGNIKPAMYPSRTTRLYPVKQEDGTWGPSDITYIPTYGRNFFWIKQMLFPEVELQPSQRLYISTGVPPYYPSLGYDSVVPLVRDSVDNEIMICRHGDILYDEPAPVFFGRFPNGKSLTEHKVYGQYSMSSDSMIPGTPEWDASYETYQWYEYKWFDKSKVAYFPHQMKYLIQVKLNDKQTLERAACAAIAWPDNKSEISNIPGSDKYFIAGHDRLSFGPLDGGNRKPPVSLDEREERVNPIPIKGIKYVVDSPFLKSIYDFEFNLISATPDEDNNEEFDRDPATNEVLYTYTYELIASLK